MYEVAITLKEDSDLPDEVVATLDEAVAHIERTCRNHPCPRAWINNKEVVVRNGKVLGNDGEPLCTNPAWHRTFAKYGEQILPVSENTLNDTMVKLARLREGRRQSPGVLAYHGSLEA